MIFIHTSCFQFLDWTWFLVEMKYKQCIISQLFTFLDTYDTHKDINYVSVVNKMYFYMIIVKRE